MALNLEGVSETLQHLYAENMRAVIADTFRMMWDDGTTHIRIEPNLFPRARRAYRAFWFGAQRIEDTVNVLFNGLPEPVEDW